MFEQVLPPTFQEEIKKLRDEREDSADLYKVLQKKSEGQEGCINDMELKNASLQKQVQSSPLILPLCSPPTLRCNTAINFRLGK